MREVFTFDVLASTQSKACELTRAADGAVVYAKTQTHGRGRHGRTWLSGEGSLCFSLIWTRWLQAETAFHWSFVAAVGLADALGTRIKWPNDLYVDRKKVGGILATLETDPLAVIVGVGLNLTYQPPEARAGMLGKTAALHPLVDAIEHERARYLAEGPAQLARRVRERLEFVGEKVQVVTQNGIVEGVLTGIDDSFQLLLADKPAIAASEVWPLEGAR